MEVVFSHVFKQFGSILALNDLDFTIKSGEFVFVTGPSGAGKSSIIKLILRQYQPTSGEIKINGQSLINHSRSDIDNIRRKIGVIFQDYQLIPDKTVEENIALALDIIGTPTSSVAQRIDQVISATYLGTRRHLFPSQLSGGELQRAALARALSVQPLLILADEPTGNLDTENAWNIIKLLKDINQQSGTTVIITSHNTDIVESLNHRIINLEHGKINTDQPSPQPIVRIKQKTKK